MPTTSMEDNTSNVYEQLMALAHWDENNVVVGSHVAPVQDGHRKPGHIPHGLSNHKDDASSSPPKVKRKRATRSVNITRERRKQEIDDLRGLVFELEVELSMLQSRRNELLRPHLTADTGELVTTVPVWEDMAKRQFQARRQAESVNLRLKTLLATHAQVAQDLISVAQRAKGIEQNADDLQGPSEQANIIPEQLKRLEVVCAQWFEAFTWYPKLQTRPMRLLESHIVSDDGKDTVIDIYCNQSFPFPVADVEDAIWSLFQTHCVDAKCFARQNCEWTNDTLIGIFAAKPFNVRSHTTLNGSYVTRRFRNEQGHFIMASHVHAVPKSANDPRRDFVLTEDTWIRVMDARELSGVISTAEAVPTLTVLQHIRRSRYCYSTMSQCGQERVPMLRKAHLSLLEEELRWGQESIESMLMLRSKAQ